MNGGAGFAFVVVTLAGVASIMLIALVLVPLVAGLVGYAAVAQ